MSCKGVATYQYSFRHSTTMKTIHESAGLNVTRSDKSLNFLPPGVLSHPGGQQSQLPVERQLIVEQVSLMLINLMVQICNPDGKKRHVSGNTGDQCSAATLSFPHEGFWGDCNTSLN